ncbi:MAG: APC family permease [Anaerolineae bacterium]|nr:APC family permease [Anaerolineae bacterium]
MKNSNAQNGDDKSSNGRAGARKINPDLIVSEVRYGARPGDKYVRLNRTHARAFRKVGPGHFVATPASNVPATTFERVYRAIKRVLVGRPLETAEEIHERLSKVKGLAVFGSDAISSSAYATEATLIILMVAGNQALGITFYTSLAVGVMFAVIAFSYRQTIHAYPQGGGSYRVSRENLGTLAGLVAASALLIDYVLTVAVSIAAGSAAIISAFIAAGYSEQIHTLDTLLPHPFNLNVFLSLFFIGLLMLGNLRGIRESGTIFAIPTYLFIISLSIVLVVGLFKAFTGTLYPPEPPPILPVTEPLSVWLILRAFSAGAVAMSGTEAIADGVPAFKPPESKNAATTLTVMAMLLGSFFLGVSFLATHIGLVPGKETIISQVARAALGTSVLYYIFQIATMGILVIAANTAFADFPRLSSILARDNFMPHQFLYRGDRLAFSIGIIALGSIAALLVILFAGEVDSLIHLYAVGVFLAFTLSNSGMVMHWRKLRTPNWQHSAIINGIGATLSAITLLIIATTKFALGAWISIVLIPIITLSFHIIHTHYTRVAEQLRILPDQLPPQRIQQLVIVPIDDVNYASLRAMAFARTICSDVIVLHIALDTAHAEKVRQKMQTYAPDLKLVVVDSPLRAFVRPLVSYVDAVHSQYPDAFVTIVLPEFITAHWWEQFLHNRTAARLQREFEKHPNVAVVLVPYLLEK